MVTSTRRALRVQPTAPSVRPSQDNIVRGVYPLFGDLYFYTRGKPEGPERTRAEGIRGRQAVDFRLVQGREVPAHAREKSRLLGGRRGRLGLRAPLRQQGPPALAPPQDIDGQARPRCSEEGRPRRNPLAVGFNQPEEHLLLHVLGLRGVA